MNPDNTQIRLNYIRMFEKQMKFLQDKVADEYKTSIKKYTSSDYYEELNEKMRTDKKLDENLMKIRDDIKMIFKIIPQLENSVIIYRSINAKELNMEFLKKQFISTSLISDVNKYPHNRYNNKCCL